MSVFYFKLKSPSNMPQHFWNRIKHTRFLHFSQLAVLAQGLTYIVLIVFVALLLSDLETPV